MNSNLFFLYNLKISRNLFGCFRFSHLGLFFGLNVECGTFICYYEYKRIMKSFDDYFVKKEYDIIQNVLASLIITR